MLIKHHKYFQFISVMLLSFWFLAESAGVWAQTNEEMQQRYRKYLAQQTESSLPFTLESTDKKGLISASVTTFLPDVSFPLFAKRLSSAKEWCEFVPLHPNVKACRYEMSEDSSKLGLYVGVKGYMQPDEAKLLLLGFKADIVDAVLLVKFNANTGPYGSSKYRYQFRAIEGKDGVYFEFDLSSKPGLVANLAKIYLATVGRSKVGFSTVGNSWSGEPEYVRGQRGGAERNIVRYLLSIKAYFETINSESTGQDYLDRLVWWFDLTLLHPRQLYEMSKKDYLAIKMRERKNQIILMDSLKNNTTPLYEPPRDLP